MKIKWKLKRFSDLSTIELYNLLALRIAVFVIEQNCPYQECDEKDIYSHHLIGMNEQDEIIVYMRILPQNISYNEVSMGRIVTSSKLRGTGLGKELMHKGLECVEIIFGKQSIRISAQSHLVGFYSTFGFKSTGKEYLEDDIPHTEMLRSL